MSWPYERPPGSGGGPASEALKLIEEFDTDAGTLVGDLVRVNGSSSVTKILTNDISEIPKGVFGVVFSKPSTLRARVLFIGIKDGYTGFTTGDALFVDTDGTLTHTAPATETVQQIGFAVTPTQIFVNIKLPTRKST